MRRGWVLGWLAVVWVTTAGAGWAAGVRTWPLTPGETQATGPVFTSMPSSQTGITFTNALDRDAEAENHNLLNGSGLALGDLDGDGWVDIVFCSLNGRCAVYRNLGDWRFEEVSSRIGLDLVNQEARGAVIGDVDGDGDQDLLMTFSGRGVRVFLNQGDGRLTEADRPELRAQTGSTSMALGDVDGDGDLDLYVANYGENTIRSGMRIATRVVGGKVMVVGRYRNRLKIIDGKLVEYGEPDALYLNDGRGGFAPVPWTEGAFRDEAGAPLSSAPPDLGFSVIIRDINQDGSPDIYVCNDFQDPDRLWLGDGRGRFQLAPRETLRAICNFSMTADFADVNRDGLDDLVVTDMLSRFHNLRMMQLSPASPPMEHTFEPDAERPQERRNMLFLNRGDGTYAEIGQYAGLAASDWTWTAAFLDADLDGWDDLLVGNGHYYDTQDLDAIERSRTIPEALKHDGRRLLDMFPLLRTPNMAFRNRGDLHFDEVGAAWGFDSLEVSHSIARGDLDNDGDLDVAVNCLRAPALVYRNNSAAPRVAVRLKGQAPNTAGIGARIRLSGGSLPAQEYEMTLGGRYLASDQPVRVFATGHDQKGLQLEVRWRSGRRSVLSDVRPNLGYEIDEADATAPAPAESPAPVPAPWFAERSAILGLLHREDDWDDFLTQPTLPRRLSRGGPGVAWLDWDADGDDDLVVGASRGERPRLFRNDGRGGFSPVAEAFPEVLPDDTAGLVGWSGGGTVRAVLAGRAQVLPSTVADDGGALWRFDGPALQSSTSLHLAPASAGPVTVGDIDRDGDLDVFVGGRYVPGRYPQPAPSTLLLNVDGRLQTSDIAAPALASLGLVTAATFSDLTGDGFPELVVACEWGPVRVFAFDQGKPIDMARTSGFPSLTGLWTSLATGDFDGDGRLDVVAGNWGLNSGYQVGAPGPWYLYYGDLNGDGRVQLLEAYREPGRGRIQPWRDMSVVEQTFPWVRERFPTHRAYGQAEVAELLGDRSARTQRVEAGELGSFLFLNRTAGWEARRLPPEAQWSPAMGAVVADFDADGNEDLFLSQNFFAGRPGDPRLSAGRGLLLRGRGDGTLSAVSGMESGIKIYGEQRACAAADYDADGRIDLAVAENGGALHLYQNVKGSPGLRVKLLGSAANPTAVGARLRVVHRDGTLGPVREVQASNGGWSQNGEAQVLGLARECSGVEVLWPGGSAKVYPLPPGARSLELGIDSPVR